MKYIESLWEYLLTQICKIIRKSSMCWIFFFNLKNESIKCDKYNDKEGKKKIDNPINCVSKIINFTWIYICIDIIIFPIYFNFKKN